MFDVVEILRRRSAGREDAWRRLRTFSRDWAGIDLPEPRGDVLEDVKRRVGRELPPALHEAYSMLAGRQTLTSHQDQLYEPERIAVEGHVLVLRMENQGCAKWGVHVDDLTIDDPPVLQIGSRSSDRWKPHFDCASKWFLELVVREAGIWGAPIGDNGAADDDRVARVVERFSRLDLPDYAHWATQDGAPPTRWFGRGDVLITVDGGHWLWVSARTRESLDRVRDELPGKWILCGA